ncbi:MAG: transposase, partial [Acidobacteria bacterium]|nr:transposase [Acidobacteriota bacterium]
SRRKFTKEFKLAAVRRLEQGISIAEAARALEVSGNVLYRWRREFRQGAGNALPGNGKQRCSDGQIAELERFWRTGTLANPPCPKFFPVVTQFTPPATRNGQEGRHDNHFNQTNAPGDDARRAGLCRRSYAQTLDQPQRHR